MKIDLKTAQKILINSQGYSGQDSSAKVLEKLGYIQIDTISVIERAHQHIFWSRNKAHTRKTLEKLIQKRKAFEYWSHAASFLPISSYRYTLPQKRNFLKRRSPTWSPSEKKQMAKVKKAIVEEGPLSSRDFGGEKSGSSGWWNWKPTKVALERLFLSGQLEVTRRTSGFHKVYDVPERVIPGFADITPPTEAESLDFMIDQFLKSQGLASASEVAYLYRAGTKKKVAARMDSRSKSGNLVEIEIKGVPDIYYATQKHLEQNHPTPRGLHLLSPFDNLVIQRKRLKQIFDFDYQLECYVPQKKRRYGYFCLPILSNARFVGQVDCKFDRAHNQMIVQSMHLDQKASTATNRKVEKAIEDLRNFCFKENTAHK